MKKSILYILFAVCLGYTNAQTVDSRVASTVAAAFVAAEEPCVSDMPLSLKHTFRDSDNNPRLYVFNIGTTGFVITSADMQYCPIVGYSLNGAFDTSAMPPSLISWLNSTVNDIAAVESCGNIPENIVADRKKWHSQWEAVAKGDYTSFSNRSGKGVSALVTTRWDQGAGYNNMCPTYPAGFNGANYNNHSYTGCVATAMAQIIRYHRYPSKGFARHSYTHSYYGYLSVDYDSTTYNYNMMPNTINYYSPSAQQQAVSQLCYHCGVAVNMNYENPGHTTGSGAYSTDVAEALKHFGYTEAFYRSHTPGSPQWDSLLVHDLDLGRPVYYSGNDGNYGHAFVCDGYNNSGQYHFNFGWSGSGDGFYSLSSVNGFNSSQAAVFNIYPSNLTEFHDTMYVAENGQGDGSSWANAFPNLNTVIKICGLYKRGNIWVKNGTYHGSAIDDAAFTMQSSVKIYGGFNGTEQSLDQRDLTVANSVMTGDGQRRVVDCAYNLTNAYIYNMTIANGRASDGAGISLYNGTRLEGCVIENNMATSAKGSALLVNSGTVFNCVVRNNNGVGVSLKEGRIVNSLIAHNNGNGISAGSSSGMQGCDIVCNSGVGVDNTSNTRIQNCVIWHNDSSLTTNDISRITFSAIEGFGETDSNSNFGISRINRPDDGIGPFFIAPDTTKGVSNTMGDWHLSSLSPLVNAGDTIRNGYYDPDLDGNGRKRGGRIDIGCYEHDPYVGIETPVETASLHIYPNPASTTLCIESTPGTVQIFDAMGRCVLNAETSEERTIVNVGKLQRGVYLIRINNTTSKFIKK